MSEERLLKIEQKIENHDKDLHSIAKSLDGINHQMAKTNEILQDFALRDERFNSKLQRTEDRLSSLINSNNDAVKRAHVRVDKIDMIINRLAWTVITLVLVGVIGATIKFGG